MIKTCIEDQCFPRRIADRPKISDRIAPEEWLGEVPYLARQREAAQELMRNRQRLAKLAAKHRPLIQYCEKGVGVVVKSLNIGACKDEEGVGRTSVIELWSAPIIRTMEIAHGQRRLRAFPVVKNRLRTEEDVANAVSRSPISCVVHYGFSRHQKLQTWRDGKFYNFIKAVPRRKLGRIMRGDKTRFKLQIPHRRDRRGSGNGGASGICFGFFHNC